MGFSLGTLYCLGVLITFFLGIIWVRCFSDGWLAKVFQDARDKDNTEQSSDIIGVLGFHFIWPFSWVIMTAALIVGLWTWLQDFSFTKKEEKKEVDPDADEEDCEYSLLRPPKKEKERDLFFPFCMALICLISSAIWGSSYMVKELDKNLLFLSIIWGGLSLSWLRRLIKNFRS